MELVTSLAEFSVVLFGVALLAAQLLVHEAGFHLGLRRRQAGDRGEAVGLVVGGILALLAFVLALTLSFANTRYAERRQGTLVEANAIGTAWLRAKAIGTPRGEEIAQLLVDYTKLRKSFIVTDAEHAADIEELNNRTNALQSTIWGHLSAIVREQANPVTSSLMAALNDTFDASTSERFAFQQRLPPQILWLLLGMTLLSMSCIGYQLGLKGKPARILVGLLALVWTVVIVDILDLSASRLGTFRTTTGVYDWTLRGFEGGVTVPPL